MIDLPVMPQLVAGALLVVASPWMTRAAKSVGGAELSGAAPVARVAPAPVTVRPTVDALVPLLPLWATMVALLCLPLSSPISGFGGAAGALVVIPALAVQPSVAAALGARRGDAVAWILAVASLGTAAFFYANRSLSPWRPSTILVVLGCLMLLAGDRLWNTASPEDGPGTAAEGIRRVAVAALVVTTFLPAMPNGPLLRIPVVIFAVVALVVLSAVFGRAMRRLAPLSPVFMLSAATLLLSTVVLIELVASVNPCGSSCAIFGHG